MDIYDLGLSPELIQALADSGMLNNQLGLEGIAYATGRDKASTVLPEGRTVRDQFVASNPLEMIAATGRQMQGDREMMESQQRMAEMLRKYGGTAKQFYEAIVAAKAKKAADEAARAKVAGRAGGVGRAPAAPGLAPQPVSMPQMISPADAGPPMAPSHAPGMMTTGAGTSLLPHEYARMLGQTPEYDFSGMPGADGPYPFAQTNPWESSPDPYGFLLAPELAQRNDPNTSAAGVSPFPLAPPTTQDQPDIWAQSAPTPLIARLRRGLGTGK